MGLLNFGTNIDSLSRLVDLVEKAVSILGAERLEGLIAKVEAALDKYVSCEREHEAQDAQEEAKGEPAQKEAPKQEEPAHEATADAVDFAALDWCWGGFSGNKASAVAGVEIAKLAVGGKQMTYKWISGGCEKLGASSKTDASCIAALFCRLGGKWKGGKFDWISTSRTSRDWKNIESGYNGWDQSAIDNADAYAFVIVSKDGKKRSNVIAQGI